MILSNYPNPNGDQIVESLITSKERHKLNGSLNLNKA